MADKTNQTFEVIRERAKQVGFGEIYLKLLIHKKSIVGFEEEKPPLIKFRAQESGNKVEDAI